MVKGGIEHPLVLFAAFNLHATQQLLPTLAYLIQLCIEITIRNISFRLLLTDIRNAHLYI